MQGQTGIASKKAIQTMKTNKANFCTSVRNAIEAIGCSTVMALNVVNAELGNMKKTEDGMAVAGDVKVKRPKSEGTEWTAGMSVKLGTEKYETNKVTPAIVFAEWNDIQAKAEKSFPGQTLNIPENTMFYTWLKKVATPKVAPVEAAK